MSRSGTLVVLDELQYIVNAHFVRYLKYYRVITKLLLLTCEDNVHSS
jgi:hypothetical protein